jgi:biotin transporter BioY
VVAGAIVFYNETKRGALTAAQSSAITQMLVIGTLGLVGVLLQIRLAVMAAPAVGFLTGFVLSTLLAARAHQRSGRNSICFVASFFT